MLQAYHPSNRFSTNGLLFLILAVICGGVVLGGLAYAVSNLVWLIIVFPIGLGLLAGAVLAGVIRNRRIRNPALGIAAGVLIGVVIYGTMQYGDYIRFQSGVREAISQEESALTPSEQNEMIDLLLEMETGSTGFFGFLKLMAQEGVSIGKIGRGNNITLNEPLTWAYWLIELGIISGLAALAGREAARKPFCEACQQWHRGGEHLGSAAGSIWSELLGYVQSGSFRQAGALLAKENAPAPSLEVYLQRCQREQEHPSVLTIRRASLNAKGKTEYKDVLTAMIAPHEIGELVRGQAERSMTTA